MQNFIEIIFNESGNSARIQADNLNINDVIIVETNNDETLATVSKINVELNNVDNIEMPRFIRKATEKDKKNFIEKQEKEKKVFEQAKLLIEKHKLDMKLISAKYSFDFSKIYFVFTSDGRVDFRELVKDLATTLKARIELKQVGIRDEAKILGGIGPCGRQVCCKNHLKEFCKVSIKMAKNQSLSLNPSNISGLCGRLMCCLSYEDSDYCEVLKKMPKLNSKVKTSNGEGVVIFNNLLKQTVSVKFYKEGEIAEIIEIPLAEVEFNRDNNEN